MVADCKFWLQNMFIALERALKDLSRTSMVRFSDMKVNLHLFLTFEEMEGVKERADLRSKWGGCLPKPNRWLSSTFKGRKLSSQPVTKGVCVLFGILLYFRWSAIIKYLMKNFPAGRKVVRSIIQSALWLVFTFFINLKNSAK